MPSRVRARHAGLLVPLVSMPSASSWGVGEISDIPVMAAWLRECGLDMLQLLPLNEMATGQNSPYCPMSAFALDPLYISPARIPEFLALGGVDHLPPGVRDRLGNVQNARTIRYRDVRRIKHEALEAAYRQFLRAEWRHATSRAGRFETFRREEAWWLRDYALFRALHEHFDARPWTEWPGALRDRDPALLGRAGVELKDRTLFFEYLQWIASEQWQEARRDLAGVWLVGDLPFMVSLDSADVWARRSQFDLGARVGVPTDACSATGRGWALPVYRWDVHAGDDYRWLRERARRSAALYDALRIDHLVGFYVTYGIPRVGEPFFVPTDPAEQIAQGERLMRIFCGSGIRIIADDLGTLPDHVRGSLARLGMPGFTVLRWDRDGDAPCPAASRDARLRVPLHAGSELLSLPVQDVFGGSDRIDGPTTVGAGNWTYRLPWPLDRLGDTDEARDAASRLRRWAAAPRLPVPTGQTSQVPASNAHLPT